MPVGLYKNDGSGRDSYINQCALTDKGRKTQSGDNFWPDRVAEHQNRKREAVNNLPLSKLEKRREYDTMLPQVPIKSSYDIAAKFTPRRDMHSPNLDTNARFSPTTDLNLSNASIGSARGMLRSLSPGHGGSTTPRGPINSFSNFFMESTAHKTAREGRFNVGSEAPPNPDVLPAIRNKAKPGVGQYA